MAIVNGTDAADLLSGTDGEPNSIYAYSGDDSIYGRGSGPDFMDGGRGQDMVSYFYSVTGVAVNLRAGTGAGGYAEGDSYRFVEDVQGSSNYNDVLIGNGVSNVLEGLGGGDRINGWVGADFMLGGEGLDTLDYAGSFAGVTVSLLAGTAKGGDARGDELFEFENLSGSSFADALTGDAEANRLVGRAGNDRLAGGIDADILSGGAGADRFIYRSTNDSSAGLAGRDRITDFRVSGGDLIDLSVIDAKAGLTGNQAFSFIGTGAFTRAGGQVRTEQSGGTTYVYADVNGDKDADFSIALTGRLALTGNDFVL